MSGKFILPELPAVSLESTGDLERETEWTKVMLNSWKPSLCGRHHGSYTWDKTYFIQDFLMLCYLDFVHLFVSSFSYLIFTHFIRGPNFTVQTRSQREVNLNTNKIEKVFTFWHSDNTLPGILTLQCLRYTALKQHPRGDLVRTPVKADGIYNKNHRKLKALLRAIYDILKEICLWHIVLSS